MSYLALYRKYRPKKFEQVAGQKHIIKILKNAIITQNISHAYLFSGPRGTGKTSVAKIFARSVNCLSPVDGEICEKCEVCKAILDNDIDIIEIDAASNNGVDEIREIRNNVKLLPSVGKYKVYIIDEVHMLSLGAFNALLKTLEEPPQHVIFILATTEIQKIPSTIISRCQRFDFKKINNSEIKEKLCEILKNEKRKLPEEILELISEISNGGLRDAINTLDQVLTYSNEKINVDDVYNLIGEISQKEIEQMFDYVLGHNITAVLDKINSYYEEGKNLELILERLILLIKNVNINNNVKNYFSDSMKEKLDKYSGVSNEIANYLSNKLIKLLTDIKKTDNPKLLLEITFLEIIESFSENDEENQEGKENVQKCEEKIEKNGENESKIISREIISIRINNSLCTANKEILKEMKKKLENLSDYVSNKKYNKVANILLNSDLIVASESNLMFSYLNEFDLNSFYLNIDKIEKFLSTLFEKKYVIVAVTSDEWAEIKKEYVKNLKNGIKYMMKEEPKIEESVKKSKKDSIAEAIFGEESIDLK